jgi:hypothetical protein
VLVAVVAPANHRWHDTSLSRDVNHGGAAPFVSLPLHAAPTASRAQFAHQVHWPAWIGWAVAAVGALIVLTLVALLLSALWPFVRDLLEDLIRRLRRRPAPLLAGSDLEHDLGGYADALRARVEQAAATLRADRRTSGDSVIACWLVLEDAAAESGTERQGWQTPSEFTADLLLRQHADPAACARLLRLYQRARFGHEALAADDTAAAAQALAVIAATLRDHIPAALTSSDPGGGR